jgi:hypothetical protein
MAANIKNIYSAIGALVSINEEILERKVVAPV